MSKVGIAITTTDDRKGLFDITLKAVKKNAPKGSFVFVYNDKEREGINVAKNKCLEALMAAGCDYLFLFDDDCYPKDKEAFEIFLNSGLEHASLTFCKLLNGSSNGNALRRSANGVDEFVNPCGIMLFYTRKCIELVGGVDLAYSKWGHEHVGHSWRIHNAGLTKAPFICPAGAIEHFHAEDMKGFGSGTFTRPEQTAHARAGAVIIQQEKSSIDWKPFAKNDYVLSSYFTKNLDAQRRRFALPSIDPLMLYINSLKAVGLTGVLFNDCFRNFSEEHIKFVRASCPRNFDLYNYRHLLYVDWLKKNRRYIENVYMTDNTDVEFFKKPEIEKGKIYVGSENETCDLQWLKNLYSRHTRKKEYPIEKLSGKKLLNCGIIYGHVDDIIPFLEEMNKVMLGQPFMDMFALNWVGHQLFSDKIVTGFPIHTEFRKEQGSDSGAYIKHK